VAVVGIVGAFIDVDTLVVNEHISSWTVFGTSPTAGSVSADFVVIAVISIVVTFVDVDTFTVFFLVSLGTDTIAVFLDKSGFAVAVKVAVCVFACFGGSVACVCTFVAFVDVDTFSVFEFVSILTNTFKAG
jgi:hypothetical protein